ncbi:Scr1 family TA system antitoxin-like transcriptional regulator [Streptomyces sp. NPDC002520]
MVPQVLPWNAPTRPFTAVTLPFIEMPDEPSFVYAEGPYHGLCIDDPVPFRQYRKAYERLRAAAMSPEAPLDEIESAAEDYRHGNRRARLRQRGVAEEQPQQR